MPDEWYYARNKKQRGPVSAAELKELADAGDLEPDDKVWKDGMPKWVAARSVKGLFSSQAVAGKASAPPAKPARGKSAKAADPDKNPFEDLDEADGQEDDDGRPRKKKKKTQPEPKSRGGAVLWWVLGGVGTLTLLTCCGGGTALFAFGGLNFLRPVDVTKVFQVKAGMSQAECEALMGPARRVDKKTVPGNQVFFMPPGVTQNKATYEVKQVFWEDGRGGRAELSFVDDKCLMGFN